MANAIRKAAILGYQNEPDPGQDVEMVRNSEAEAQRTLEKVS